MRMTPVEAPEHEEVVRIEDDATGLRAFIAVHSTARGPAAGGLRMRAYGSEDAALTDVLRLSRGMTFKNAAADLPLGGGKAVIIGHPDRDKTPELLAAMGRAIDRLDGRYWTAEDMGMTPDDMAQIATETTYVAGRAEGPFASGDPSPVTAEGILRAMQVVARHVWGSDDLAGRRVALQGLGHVGWHLARMLRGAGAGLVVSDVERARVDRAEAEFGAQSVEPDAIYDVEADIFAPCAVGAVLNDRTIPRLRVKAVVGGANNQLAEPADADRLHERGILYAPDYLANAGGIINVAAEILQVEDRKPWVARRLDALAATMDRILAEGEKADTSPDHVAEAAVAQVVDF